MAKEKKDKKPKYMESPQVEETVKNILKNCSNIFTDIAIDDVYVLFRNGKIKSKNVSAKLIKEPISFLTAKKVLLLVTFDWWEENVDSDRVKGLIEGLLSITRDEDGNYAKKDFDIQTYSELVKDPEFDYSRFSKVLPAEAKTEVKKVEKPKAPDLVLVSE